MTLWEWVASETNQDGKTDPSFRKPNRAAPRVSRVDSAMLVTDPECSSVSTTTTTSRDETIIQRGKRRGAHSGKRCAERKKEGETKDQEEWSSQVPIGENGRVEHFEYRAKRTEVSTKTMKDAATHLLCRHRPEQSEQFNSKVLKYIKYDLCSTLLLVWFALPHAHRQSLLDIHSTFVL